MSATAVKNDGSDAVLVATGVKKVYGATVALADGNLIVRPGEVHGLVGENGAGKSTLVRIIAGLEQPDFGSVRLFGEEVSSQGIKRRAELGCAVIHQDLGLVESLSVSENIALSVGFPERAGRIDWRATREQARRALAQLGASIDVDASVSELTLAEQAVVALARSITTGARLIILDEPTANLQAAEVRAFFSLLTRLSGAGVACLLISHRTDDILSSCTRVTVLRDGRTVAAQETAALTEKDVIRLIIGRDAAELRHEPPAATPGGTKRLLVKGLRIGPFGPLDLSVSAGEILGITGLADSGHLAYGEALFGLTECSFDDLRLDGDRYRPTSARGAVRAGLGFVPPDRRRSGLAMDHTACENIFMSPALQWYRPNSRRREEAATLRLLERFDVRPPDPERPMTAFSGGNQQKVLLAKWLRGDVRLLIVNEPTAAVDVGAKFEIYEKLQAARDEGLSVLLISSDFEEIVTVSDRVLVLRRGKLQAEFVRDSLDIAGLTEAAYGVTA